MPKTSQVLENKRFWLAWPARESPSERNCTNSSKTLAAKGLGQRPFAYTGAFDDVKLSYRRVFISRQGSTPGRDRVKGRFTVLSSRHLRRLVGACLAFVCTSHHELRGSRTLKTPFPHVGNRSYGRWHGNTQQRVGRCGGGGGWGGGMIKRVTVATPNGGWLVLGFQRPVVRMRSPQGCREREEKSTASGWRLKQTCLQRGWEVCVCVCVCVCVWLGGGG